MKKIIFATVLLLGVLAPLVASCQKNDGIPDWPWKDPEPQPEGKHAYIWIDASANFKELASSKTNIAAELEKIKKMGFTDVIVDVRGTDGDVLFTSKIADPMLKTDIWAGGYHWEERTADFDYLQAFIDEARPLGLGVCAAINTFVGGHKCYYGLGQSGLLYRDPSKKSWASVINTSSGLTNSLDMPSDGGTIFLSPSNPEVQEYILGIIGELAAYDLDGIILDRCRYDDYNLQADFSDSARKGFEEYRGSAVANWPTDIMSRGAKELPSKITAEFKSWMAYKATVIHDFVVAAGNKVHSINPDMKFGVYVGGWLSQYYYSGVNWASPNYNIKKLSEYGRFANSDYQAAGYADHCDFMFIGAYAGTGSIHGSGEWTMEGFCKKAGEYTCGEVTYHGGPDIGNSTGFETGEAGAYMPDIVQTCMSSSNGGMFMFDLVHIRMYNYWDDIKKAFDQYSE